jgi:hypothetical protein
MTLDGPRTATTERTDGPVRDAFIDDLFRQFREAPPKPVEKTQDFVSGDTNITLTTKDGVGVYYKDGKEEWDSKDGKLWIRRGTNGIGLWRGSIEIDKDGSVVETGEASGVKYVRNRDGSSSKCITTAKGDELSLTTNKDGSQTFKGTTGTWTSNDGLNWKNGEKTFAGRLGIDASGRYWRQAAGNDKIEYAERSAENKKVLDKMNEMEKKYNISFGTPGQEIEYEYRDAEQDKYIKTKVNYRFPTSGELDILDKSLTQFGHLAATPDGLDYKGLKFNFISANGEGYRASLYGWYNSQKEGVSQITFAPRNGLKNPEDWEGLRGTALHEIAHHLQYKLWDKGSGKETPKSVLDAFNFQHDAASGNYRLKDKDGNLWERHEIRSKDKDTGKWGYRDRYYPVISGAVVKEEGRARTTQEMRDSLPRDKKPCTNYFTYPTEAHAEALSMYLFDRRMLWEKNAKLYQSTKAWDQGDIDRRYGLKLTKEGAWVPNYIRGVDGGIVENKEENARKVREMEESWTKKAASATQQRIWQQAINARDLNREENRDSDALAGDGKFTPIRF